MEEAWTDNSYNELLNKCLEIIEINNMHEVIIEENRNNTDCEENVWRYVETIQNNYRLDELLMECEELIQGNEKYQEIFNKAVCEGILEKTPLENNTKKLSEICNIRVDGIRIGHNYYNLSAVISDIEANTHALKSQLIDLGKIRDICKEHESNYVRDVVLSGGALTFSKNFVYMLKEDNYRKLEVSINYRIGGMLTNQLNETTEIAKVIREIFQEEFIKSSNYEEEDKV